MKRLPDIQPSAIGLRTISANVHFDLWKFLLTA
jgi:hypothetical protein